MVVTDVEVTMAKAHLCAGVEVTVLLDEVAMARGEEEEDTDRPLEVLLMDPAA